MRLVVVIGLVASAAACRPPGYGKDGIDAGASGDGATASDAAATGDGGSPDAPPACQASFRLEGHGGAASVWLTGDFVAWAGSPPGAIVLVRGGDGAWTVVHGFAPGSYVYKFIVDGSSWIPDPANPNTVPDGFGGVNSVYACP